MHPFSEVSYEAIIIAYVLQNGLSAERVKMDYAELVKSEACQTDIQQYLADGDTTAITIRLPKNLRDAAKEAAAMRGMGFSTFVRMCLIEELKKGL